MPPDRPPSTTSRQFGAQRTGAWHLGGSLGIAALTTAAVFLAWSHESPLLIALTVPLAGWLAYRMNRGGSRGAVTGPADTAAPLGQIATLSTMHTGKTAELFSSAALTADLTPLHLIVSHDDLIHLVSPQLATMLRLSIAELDGRVFSDFLPPADRARWRESVACARAGDFSSLHFGRMRLLCPKDAQSQDGSQPQVLYLDATLSHVATANLNGTLIRAQDIRAQVGLEHTLALLETRYGFLLQGIPDAIVLVRAVDRLVLDVNPGFSKAFETSRERCIGVTLDELNLWAMPEALSLFLDGVNARAGLIEQRAQLVRGPHRQTMDTRISASFTEVDGELAVLLIIRDVTERRETEMALREVEQKFALVFNAAPDGISITRLSDGVLIDVNDQLCEASGFTREEMLGRNLFELGVIGNKDEALRARQLLERFGSFRDLEITLISKQGERVPTLTSSTQINIGGESCIVTIAKDVRIMRRAEHALRISETRFRGAFEDAPLGMALVNADLQIIEGNNWLAAMMDIKPDQLPQHDLTDLLVPEERPGLEQALQELISGASTRLHREQQLQRPNGELRNATLHAVAQQDSEGAPKYLIIQLTDVTDIKRSQEQMERLAFYDPLTNLANRRLFMDRLEQTLQHATRSGRPAALFYLDLDQFKKVNDVLGHEIGDELLKNVAERLRTCVRREDTVGRPGGDEFNILLHEVRDADAAAHVADHVLAVLREPVIIGGHRLQTTTSIGIAMIPDDGSDANALVQRADQAMYRAKQQGRNTYRFYGDAVNARAIERLTFENALERALLRDELTLLYQPIHNLEDNSIYAVEALLRWQHPQRGLLQPTLFLDVNEHSGLLRALDMWVLRKACRQLQALDQAGVHVPAVAVNIAHRHISDPNLPRTIEQLLADSGLAPTRLQIQITEGVLTREPEAAPHWLEPLRASGLTITIDNFGAVTGSLTSISRLPIQRVKLDTTVIHRLTSSREAAIMVDTVVSVCAGLGRDVIAEGVETNEQRERLLRAGCKLAQGHLFGPLQTSSELLNALRSHAEPQRSIVTS